MVNTRGRLSQRKQSRTRASTYNPEESNEDAHPVLINQRVNGNGNGNGNGRTNGRYTCLACGRKSDGLISHIQSVHGGILLWSIQAIERLVTSVLFNPSSYLAMVWYLLEWAYAYPLMTILMCISASHMYTLAEGALIAWKPQFAGQGSIYGLSWSHFSNLQQSVKHIDHDVQDFQAVYGLLPIFSNASGDEKAKAWLNSDCRTDSTSLKCAVQLDKSIETVETTITKLQVMLNGRYDQLDQTEQQWISYVLGSTELDIPEDLPVGFNDKRLRSHRYNIVAVQFPHFKEHVLSSEQRLQMDKKISDSLNSWSNKIFDWWLPNSVRAIQKILSPTKAQRKQQYSIYNTQLRLDMTKNVLLPWYKWIVQYRSDYFKKFEADKFNTALVSTTYGSFLDHVFNIYLKNPADDKLNNVALWETFVHAFTEYTDDQSRKNFRPNQSKDQGRPYMCELIVTAARCNATAS